MPAVSEKQRRLMLAARAYREGKYQTDSPTVKKVADSMSKADLDAFSARVETPAERKHRVKRVMAAKLARGR